MPTPISIQSMLVHEGDLLAQLTFAERAPVTLWQDVLRRFEAAPDKGEAMRTLTTEYAGVLKISQGTLYRKLEAYRKEGLAALFPRAARRRILRESRLPTAFVTWWQTLCCDSQRMTGTAAAYRSLFNDHLGAGRVIPGYNTDWRGIWTLDHDGAQPPEVYPYVPDKTTPHGWSMRSLYRYAPDEYGRTAARIGTKAARELLPKIPSTRVGLRFGSVFIADDRFHDAQVKFAGNLSAQGVVELGAIELLTAHYCTWGAKPVREQADGTREHLREAFMRYLVADILCRIGYDPLGCTIIGEHGTARIPEALLALITRLTCGKVTFQAGAILNAPIVRGLLPGAARGNFRMKAALESAHNRYKNDMALLPGQKGADPAHAPENLPAQQSYHRALMKACVALAGQNPDLMQHVSSPFPDYYSYLNAVGLVYDRIAATEQHHLEGFEQCGFVVDEFSLFGDTWRPLSDLDQLPAEQRAMIRAALALNPRSQRPRVMSRREAFAYCQRRSDLMRLPDSIVPELLGPELGDLLMVGQDATLSVPDKYLPRVAHQVAAVAVLPSGCHQPLNRGTRWLVHLNPLSATQAFISTPDGIYVGKAPVMVAGTKYDVHHANLALLNQMEAAELKRLAPVGEKRLREMVAMKATNFKALTGRDALAEAAEATSARDEIMRRDISDDDLAAAVAGDRAERVEAMDMGDIADLLKL
jgi:hypothetical protein